jgi:hypothetical protein
LTLSVIGEQQKASKQRSLSAGLGGSGNTTAAKHARADKRGSEQIVKPALGISNTTRSRVTDRFRYINDFGNTVTSLAGQARLSVQYQLRAENECLAIKEMISQRVNEIKQARMNGLEKDSNSFSNYKGQGGIYMSGCTMPG